MHVATAATAAVAAAALGTAAAQHETLFCRRWHVLSFQHDWCLIRGLPKWWGRGLGGMYRMLKAASATVPIPDCLIMPSIHQQSRSATRGTRLQALGCSVFSSCYGVLYA